MLHIEKTYSDRCFDTYTVDGLSVEEMNEILNASNRNDKLVEVMSRHGEENIAKRWYCGYGIYHIGHVGEHLFVEVGNSCD